MEMIKYSGVGWTELTAGEAKYVNGGAPSKSTSFFYDAFYYVSTGVGKVYKAAVAEGMFTKSWWVDFSIDLSS